MSKHGIRWFCLDTFSGMIAFIIAYYISPKVTNLPVLSYLITIGFIYGVILSSAVLICGVPVPKNTQNIEIYQTITTTIISVLLAYLLFSFILNLLLFNILGRYIFAFTTLISSITLISQKLICQYIIKSQPKNILIYGVNDLGIEFFKKLMMNKNFKSVGFLNNNQNTKYKNKSELIIHGNAEFLTNKKIKEINPHIIVICDNEKLDITELLALSNLPQVGVEIINHHTFIENYYEQIHLGDFSSLTKDILAIAQSNKIILLFKRILDIFFSIIGLILSIPVFLIVAFGIKLDTSGPVIYRQKRVGLNGRIFTIYKFRTMVINAEEGGAQWAKVKDLRITFFGFFLRLTRLDELPQLFNIIRGEMSIVGPRPERPEFCKMLNTKIPLYNYRHLTKPGLTGWAQIRYRYASCEADSKKKLQYDLYYIRHMSLLLDIKIIMMTIPMLMKGSR